VRLSYQVRAGDWTLLGRGSARIFRNEPTATLGVEPSLVCRSAGAARSRPTGSAMRFAVRTDAFLQGGEGACGRGQHRWQVRVLNDRIGIDLRSYLTTTRMTKCPSARATWTRVSAGADFKLWDGVHLALLGEELLTPFVVHAFAARQSLGRLEAFAQGGLAHEPKAYRQN